MVEESRKRTLVDGDGGEVEWKKFNRGNEPLLKLMVPNFIAGVLIGKGGTFLREMKSKYGGHIRLSGNREYYPGTDERVLAITGTLSEINDINNFIMEKLGNPGREPLREGRGDKVKIIVTNLSAGLLIGRSGVTIKAIQDECKVKISIADPAHASDTERILTMTGSLEQRMEGCKQVIEKIAEEASNMLNTNLRYGNISHHDNGNFNSMQRNERQGGDSYQSHDNRRGHQAGSNRTFNELSGLLGNMRSSLENSDIGNQLFSVLSGGASNNRHHHKEPFNFKAKAQVELQVPNIMVGLLMGKNGQNLKDFKHRTGGARFAFSNKDEYIEGTTDRTLTISGSMEQVQAGYSLVIEKSKGFEIRE